MTAESYKICCPRGRGSSSLPARTNNSNSLDDGVAIRPSWEGRFMCKSGVIRSRFRVRLSAKMFDNCSLFETIERDIHGTVLSEGVAQHHR